MAHRFAQYVLDDVFVLTIYVFAVDAAANWHIYKPNQPRIVHHQPLVYLHGMSGVSEYATMGVCVCSHACVGVYDAQNTMIKHREHVAFPPHAATAQYTSRSHTCLFFVWVLRHPDYCSERLNLYGLVTSVCVPQVFCVDCDSLICTWRAAHTRHCVVLRLGMLRLLYSMDVWCWRYWLLGCPCLTSTTGANVGL